MAGVGPAEYGGPTPRKGNTGTSDGVGLADIIGPIPNLSGTYPKYTKKKLPSQEAFSCNGTRRLQPRGGVCEMSEGH